MMEDPNKNYKPEDMKEFHSFTGKFFIEGLWGFVIFGIPAAIAVIVGKKADMLLHSEKIATLVFLLMALALGWTIVLKRNAKIVGKYRNLRKKMEDRKQKN